MALMEIDEVAVDRDLYEQAKSGDENSLQKLRAAVNGLFLYLHAMPVKESETVVTVRELHEIDAIYSITLGVGK